MTIKERVQTRLKPKVRQFGFTKKVFKSVAAQIADKLEDIDENASEDDINAKIDEAILASLPYLALIQSQANEQLAEWKKGLQKNDDDDNDDDDDSDDDDDDSKSSRNRQNRSTKSAKTKDKDETGQSKVMKELLDAVSALTNEMKTLKGEKVADTRRAKLEGLLKDTGTFGKSKLRDFSRATFKDDDDFDDYYSSVEEDLKAYNQERADAGLSTMGTPPGGKGGKQEKTIEVLSEDEIKAIAGM